MAHRVVHYLVQNLQYDGTDASKLPFTSVLENEFKKTGIKVQETTFQFGAGGIDSFMRTHRIEKEHFVCFDEIVCQNYTTDFLDDIVKLKQNVSALWLAIGGKSTTGRFGIKGIEKAGFTCPEMTYPVRNPLLIAKHAHKISQDAAENKVDICLRNDITTTVDTTLVDGSVVKLIGFSTWQYALKAALENIPFNKFAMVHIEATGDTVTEECVCAIHQELQRPCPDVVTKPQDYVKYQKWVSNPKNIKSDICIVGSGHPSSHRSNGIQTSIVILMHFATKLP